MKINYNDDIEVITENDLACLMIYLAMVLILGCFIIFNVLNYGGIL